MAIITTPGTSPLSAYLPNVFVTSQASANEVKWAYVEIFINTISIATIAVPLRDEQPLGTYNFEFDIQAILQDALQPFADQKSEVISAFNATSIGLITAAQLTYYVDVTYKYIDPTTGLLTDLGVTDTSGDFYALAGTLQRTEAQNFTAFIPVAAAPNFQRWLTNAPLTQNICSTENAFLSHIAINAATKMRVRTYNSSGVLIDEGYTDVDTSPIFEVQRLGVGVPNLSGIAWTDNTGAPTTVSFSGIAYYTIELSSFAPGFPYYLEIRRFNLVSCCDGAARVHWLNLLGGGDAYTFKSKQRVSNSISYTQATKTLDKTFNYSDKGAFKIHSTSRKIYEATSEPLSVEEAEWLKELALSVEAYLETEAGFLPIIVTVEEVEVEKQVNGELNLVQIKITFQEANDLIIQHA
jgi:hypothetical protein